MRAISSPHLNWGDREKVFEKYMDTRQEDMEQLKAEYDQTNDPAKRRLISETAQKISKESGQVKSMRLELIKATQSGDRGKISDIHDYIKNKEEYH